MDKAPARYIPAPPGWDQDFAAANNEAGRFYEAGRICAAGR
jgi:hypothetical protein